MSKAAASKPTAGITPKEFLELYEAVSPGTLAAMAEAEADEE